MYSPYPVAPDTAVHVKVGVIVSVGPGDVLLPGELIVVGPAAARAGLTVEEEARRKNKDRKQGIRPDQDFEKIADRKLQT